MGTRVVSFTQKEVDCDTHAADVAMIATACSRSEQTPAQRVVRRKLNSYARQDKRYERAYISFTSGDVFEMLSASGMMCFYCNCRLVFAPRMPGDKAQWTLDRVDNNLAHSKTNCVVSCLKCNVAKKRRSPETFKFGKNLLVIKA